MQEQYLVGGVTAPQAPKPQIRSPGGLNFCLFQKIKDLFLENVEVSPETEMDCLEFSKNLILAIFSPLAFVRPKLSCDDRYAKKICTKSKKHKLRYIVIHINKLVPSEVNRASDNTKTATQS